MPQVGQEDVNPPLAGRQGVAVPTSGRGSGGGSGGPVSSVREGRHHRHRGLFVIRRARAGMSRSGQEPHRACAQSRHSGHDAQVVTGIESPPHRQVPAMRCTRLLFLLGIPPV
ncbi:thimet oligopeptidase [Trypanosoma cruzi]|nr:thimet oligopeptidase [Trypanosoma cruzi]